MTASAPTVTSSVRLRCRHRCDVRVSDEFVACATPLQIVLIEIFTAVCVGGAALLLK